MTARLLNIDPYGGYSFVGEPPRVVFDTSTMAPVNETQQHDRQQGMVRPPSPRASSSGFIERTLELPSWERLGRLLIDIRNSIVGRNHDASSPAAAAGTALLPASTSDNAAGENSPTVTTARVAAAEAVAAGSPVHDSGGAESGGGGASSAVAVSAPATQPQWSLPMTLSTPVRIVLRGHDEAEAVEEPVAGATSLARPASSGGGGDGGDIIKVEAAAAAAGAGAVATGAATGGDAQRYGEQQQQQQGYRRLRRPSVEKAMEVYSDGSSSSDDEEEEDGGNASRGKGKGKLRGKGGRPPESAERRTSARRQKQDEIREAHVAAAREDNIEVLQRIVF